MTNVAEQDIKTINGWVKQVDGRLDKLTEAVEQLRLGQLRFEMLLTQISDGQKQYLTPSSFDHVKILKDIGDLDDRVRELKRISEERQSVVDSSKVYMMKVDEMEKSINRVWSVVRWFGITIATIAIALAIKWLETLLVRPQLYEHTKAALAALIGG